MKTFCQVGRRKCIEKEKYEKEEKVNHSIPGYFVSDLNYC